SNKRKGSNTEDKPSLSVQLFNTFGFRVCPRRRCLPTADRHPYSQIFTEVISLSTSLKNK
ncbi:MAG: hypothetical protein H7Y04_15235, partial [Verrucomicrobia bacterium]|nr:hypothetical protein [Cytophagales bacterium]